MPYISYKDKVLKALQQSKKDICNEMGNFVTAEAQMRAPVGTAPSDKHKGNMRRSITYEIMEGNKGINVGVTADAEYAPYVEKGTSKQAAQPFLEPAVMDNIAKLEEIAKTKIRVHMGGE